MGEGGARGVVDADLLDEEAVEKEEIFEFKRSLAAVSFGGNGRGCGFDWQAGVVVVVCGGRVEDSVACWEGERVGGAGGGVGGGAGREEEVEALAALAEMLAAREVSWFRV